MRGLGVMLLATALFFVSACGQSEPRLDMSSDESFSTSSAKVLQSVPNHAQGKYISDLWFVVTYFLPPSGSLDLNDRAALIASVEKGNAGQKALHDALHGKTAAQVSAVADEIREVVSQK